MKQESMFKKEQALKQKSRFGLATTLFKKDGKLQSSAKNAIQGSVKRGNKIYPFSWTGSGRHINAKDYSPYIESALKLGGYKYKKGNDAPKGGKEGNFIQVSSKAITFLNSLK